MDVTLAFTDLRGDTREYRPFEAIPFLISAGTRAAFGSEPFSRATFSAARASIGSTAFLLETGEYRYSRSRIGRQEHWLVRDARGCPRRTGGCTSEGRRRFDRR